MRYLILGIWLIAGSGLLTAQTFLNTTLLSANLETAAAATWDATQVDLGALPADEPVVYEFMVQNTGSAPLTIESVKPSCGCTVAEYTQEAIAPGEVGYVTATYAKPKVGAFAKSVKVQTNATDEAVVLVMRGEIVAAK